MLYTLQIRKTYFILLVAYVVICIHFINSLRFSSVSNGGLSTPTSVIMPFIRLAGVTSKAGFQQSMPIKKQKCFCHEHKPVLSTFSEKYDQFSWTKRSKKRHFQEIVIVDFADCKTFFKVENTSSHCGNFEILVSFRFYVKSILRILEV